jgi:hypothetical protein
MVCLARAAAVRSAEHAPDEEDNARLFAIEVSVIIILQLSHAVEPHLASDRSDAADDRAYGPMKTLMLPPYT